MWGAKTQQSRIVEDCDTDAEKSIGIGIVRLIIIEVKQSVIFITASRLVYVRGNISLCVLKWYWENLFKGFCDVTTSEINLLSCRERPWSSLVGQCESSFDSA